MAEEVEMTPVEMTPVAGEPPKVNPLAGLNDGKPKTLKLTPTVNRPGAGATQSALKPGLKLPPKPGATVTALRPGLKLPPKPGATVSALKPGLKLPPKPGATVSALKPGVKLPTRPVIHKPGEAPSAASIPKPVQAVPPPVAATAQASASPSVPAAAPVEAPKPAAVPVDAQGVGRLPTVSASAVSRSDVQQPAAPDASAASASEQLKKVTQKLKGITQAIPQQAILRKTGIIAEDATTMAQKEAAKHKTARISLSEAIGVAPVKNENAPMKTIRIKRPIDIPGATSNKLAPQSGQAAPAAAAAGSAAEAPAATAASTTITQRKTLKIARPGAGAVRPAGRFGVKRPAASPTAAKASGDNGAASAGDQPADMTVADIPDIPNLPPVADMASSAVDTTPGWLYALSTLIQVAACLTVGALAWLLYQGTQTLFF